MSDQVKHLVAVTPFVIVPADQLVEGFVECDTCLLIEDRSSRIGEEVGGNDVFVGVTEDTLHIGLARFLHSFADFLVSGGLCELNGQVDDRNVKGGNAERHTGELTLNFGDNQCASFCGAGGRRDDVACSCSAASPVLHGRSVNGLLRCGGRVNGGHKSLYDAELVVEHLGHGSQTVGGAGSVGNDFHIRSIFVKVYAANESGGFLVLSGSGNNYFLCSAVEVSGRFLGGAEHAGGFDDILCSARLPIDVGRIFLCKENNFVAVYDKCVFLNLNGSVEMTVHSVVLEHISCVCHVDERVVDCGYDDVVALSAGSEDQTSDSSETVDTYFYHCFYSSEIKFQIHNKLFSENLQANYAPFLIDFPFFSKFSPFRRRFIPFDAFFCS